MAALRDAAAEVVRILRSDDPGQVQEGALERLGSALSREGATSPDAAAEAERRYALNGRGSFIDGIHTHCRTAFVAEAEWQALRPATPHEPSPLLLAARAVHAIRPTNWDDDEDPAQREAWAALEALLKPADEDGDACGICALALVEGDLCLTDVDLGPVHAACCGPERESYVGPDGEPLKEGEPLPTPWVWSSAHG